MTKRDFVTYLSNLKGYLVTFDTNIILNVVGYNDLNKNQTEITDKLKTKLEIHATEITISKVVEGEVINKITNAKKKSEIMMSVYQKFFPRNTEMIVDDNALKDARRYQEEIKEDPRPNELATKWIIGKWGAIRKYHYRDIDHDAVGEMGREKYVASLDVKTRKKWLQTLYGKAKSDLDIFAQAANHARSKRVILASQDYDVLMLQDFVEKNSTKRPYKNMRIVSDKELVELME